MKQKTYVKNTFSFGMGMSLESLCHTKHHDKYIFTHQPSYNIRLTFSVRKRVWTLPVRKYYYSFTEVPTLSRRTKIMQSFISVQNSQKRDSTEIVEIFGAIFSQRCLFWPILGTAVIFWIRPCLVIFLLLFEPVHFHLFIYLIFFPYSHK